MQNLQRILKLKPDVDEAELELVRFRVGARLASLNRLKEDDPPRSEDGHADVSPVDGATRAGAPAHPFVPRVTQAEPVVTEAPSQWLLVAPLEDAAGESESSVAPPAADRPPIPVDLAPPQLVSFEHPGNAASVPGTDDLDDGRPTAAAIEARRSAGPRATPKAPRPASPAAADPEVIEAGPPAQAGLFALDEKSTLEDPIPLDALVIETDPPAEIVETAATSTIETTVEVEPAADPAVIEAGPPAQPGLFALHEMSTLEAPIALEPLVFETDPPAKIVDAVVPDVKVGSRPRRAQRPARAAAARRRPADDLEDATRSSPTRPDAIESTAYCPYCASLLQPPPDATRRCLRCRQRIVVRHVGMRTVYLAEAALPFFEAERRRAMKLERWARERDRWLDLARECGAADDRLQHATGETVSEAGVAAARALYLSTVDHSFRIAKGERRWEEAAKIRYDEALVLFRTAGSPSSPPEDVVKFHREGLAADLQEIGEVSKDAELRGASCCEACQIDEGRVVRIAEELRSTRLPHRGCPKGLCRCRWFLSARDQEFLGEFLRRQARANRRLTDPSPQMTGADGA